ncbi:MAG: right-handed parallel beta-helix repeat-containing protein, partial [Candidatus Thermoplasmatota archaeon]|nr:right-handed parallel beta-helix repeat-containing protein [Candidatus Thermoplasmatota archaeon]
MHRKTLATGILLLFMVSMVSPLTIGVVVQQTNRGDTLYVGGSGPGNYTTIQEAVNAAEPGDTVFVYDESSPYNESITIAKSINLGGENKTTTVIEGNEGIEINADLVTISGFTVKYVISLNSCHNITISDNTIHGKSWNSIELIDSYNNKISYNEISGSIHGIELLYSSNNIITNNIFSNINTYGIFISLRSNNNMITGNNITNCFFGILASSRGNIIEKNNFIGNRINAIFTIFWRDILDSNYWNSNYWDNHIGDG